MINVKKVRDTIISKSVIPASQLTTVSSKEIKELQAENAELQAKKNELEATLSLQAARKVQSDHDKSKADAIRLKLEAVEDDKTGISIHRNTLTKADLMECQMLAILNEKRTNKGLVPYKDYDAYLAAQEPASAKPLPSKSLVPTTKSDPLTPLEKIAELSLDYAGRPLQAAGQVYNIVSGGYFVCYNVSRCYIQKANGEVNILVRGDTLYGDSSVMQMIPNKSFHDLTRAEFDNIIKSKPTYAELFQVYSKFRNCQNVVIDTNNAQAVW
jgi:hypothetical protein